MTLVVDASAAVAAAGVPGGMAEFGDPELVAPPLMWSEARSTLHSMLWRGELTLEEADGTRRRLEDSAIEPVSPTSLGSVAWEIADELGWAKTYDAEYLAVARILGCRVITVDRRLRRGAARLEIVIGPEEL